MKRALPVLALFAALPAWAVGEHLSVTGPAKDQLSETLCISMECGKRADYTVASKVVNGKMELKVLGPSGPRLTLTLPIRPDGRLANSDAMSATSQLVHAIEAPAGTKEATQSAVEDKPGKQGKDAKHKLAKGSKAKGSKHTLAKGSKSKGSTHKLARGSKSKGTKPMRVAARKISRG